MKHPRAVRAAAVAGSLALAASLVTTAGAATPIAPGGTPTSLPAFQGAAATANPIRGIPRTPQNPFMAPNGNNNVHNDAWMTDAYTRRGPLGRNPFTFSATLDNHVCITLTFDSRGRLVATCVSATAGPHLYMLNPSTLDVLADFSLPFRPPPAGIPVTTNTTGGAYFYLDNRNRAVMATTDRHIWIVEETGGSGTPGFRRVRDFNVGPLLAPDERLPSAIPDFGGRLWFVGRQKGTVGALDQRTGRGKAIRLNEEIENSFATSPEGVYIATDKAMYRFGLDRNGRPRVVWRVVYRNDHKQKPGQFDAGTGTTPTVMPGGYVTITDNANPLNIVVYRTASTLKRGQKRVVCEVPIFGRNASADENSLIVAGRSIVAENNYGYDLGKTIGGAVTQPGMVRVDVRADGRGCRKVWTNRTERVPSVVSKLSLATGLLHTFTKDPDPVNPTADAWFWTAVDFRTGRTVWKRLAGTGLGFNNHYAGIAIGPNGTEYVGGIGGLMAVRDSS
jgi:hypothetical protein